MIGVLAFDNMEEHDWPEPLQRRLQMIAHVFAQALDRKHVEQKVRESESRFRLVADAAPVLIWQSGTDKLCTYFNKPWLDFTGRSLESELGNGWAEGVHSEDLQRCLDTYTRSFDRREKLSMEYRLRHHDGEYRWILDVGVPRFNQDGSFAGYIGIGVDVNERKQTEEALRESEERHRHLVESANDWVWEVDANVVYTYVGPQCRKILGYEAEEIIGKTPFDLMPPEEARRVAAVFARIAAERKPFRGLENINRHRDGHLVSLETNGVPVINREGEFLGYRGMDRDITERKRAEERLQEYEKAVEGSEEMIAVVDREYRYLIANRRFLKLRNMTKEQVVGRLAPEVLNKSVFDAVVKEKLDECFAGQVVKYEMRYTYPELGERDLFVSCFPIEGATGVDRVACILQDITERKRAEEALRESEDKLRLLLDSTAEAIYGIDLEHRCTFCNPACLRALGYGHMDEVLGKNMHDLMHHRRADGTLYPLEECRIHCVAQTGEGAHADDELLSRVDGTSFPVEYWSYPQRRGQEIIGAVVAFIDITERRLAEATLANVSRKLIEAQEEERTRIARELHDDIGQRLALLAIEMEQLHQDPLIVRKVRRRMGKLQEQISRIAADTQSLSHELHSSRLEYLGIAAAMRGFCREFGKQQKVEIHFKTHDLPSPLSPDISLCLFRVLQEALHNSAKHSGVRHIEVRLWGTSGEIQLTVKDSGAGFDREAAKTSRGLGLVSMQERVKLVKGTFSIDSQPEKGTTVHVSVPLGSGGDLMRAAG